MTIEERRDAMRNGVFHLTPAGMEEWDAQLTRVLELCKAAEVIIPNADLELSGTEQPSWKQAVESGMKALASLRAHGDIPSETTNG